MGLYRPCKVDQTTQGVLIFVHTSPDKETQILLAGVESRSKLFTEKHKMQLGIVDAEGMEVNILRKIKTEYSVLLTVLRKKIVSPPSLCVLQYFNTTFINKTAYLLT